MKKITPTEIPRVGIVAAVAILLVISLLFLARMNAKPDNNDYVSYNHTVSPYTLGELETLVVDREFSGLVEAQQTLTLGFELAGTIAVMSVNDGDLVKQGQLLAQLDTQLLRGELKKLSAQYKQAQAQLVLNQKTLKRQQTLKDKNYAAGQRLDELQAEKIQLQANKTYIQAQQQQVNIRLKKSALYAPFDGQISVRYRVKGAVVSPSEPILELVEDNQLQIKVAVPLHFSKQLKQGQQVNIQTLNNTETLSFTSTIDTISRSVSSGSYTQVLRLSLPSSMSHQQLSNGQVVVANIKEPRNKTGYWIPNTALTEGLRGTWNILLLSDEKAGKRQIQKVAVTPLYFKHAQVFIEQAGYLSAGRLLVSNGAQRLSNQQWVTTP